MCAPTTAALFLAALAALPCRGINTNNKASPTYNKVPTTPETGALPTLNKIYLMLHDISTIHNHTEHKASTHSDFHTQDSTLSNLDISQYKIEERSIETTTESGIDLKDRKRNRRVVKIEKTVKDGDGQSTSLPVVLPTVMDRRRKPGETGSSSPLLNYIFDSYSNTHHHRNDRAGDGNSIYAAAAPEIEALVGSTAHLDCKVDALHDKLVSWVRRKSDEDPMELLTTGTQLYTADERYSARFIPPDIWRLEVKSVRPSDAAHYDCQLSAHPPRTARVTLRVPEVSIRIVDGAGADVSEQVCEVGSTVALRCEVRGLKLEGGPSLLWFRRNVLLNDDTTRGGISVRTEFGPNGANSMLRVARVRLDDAGSYSCSVAQSPPLAPVPARVLLHVIKGESLAELHQGGGTEARMNFALPLLTVIIIYL